MPPQIMSQPQSPDELARLAGRDLYECSVGMLRRSELWRLGNAWGLNFPVGCSKDYMIPYFKQLEADGKDPLRPPGKRLDDVVHAREVEHSTETHAEREEDPYGLVAPKEEAPSLAALKEQMSKMHVGKVRKLCKEHGLPQDIHDRKQDLIARIIDKLEGHGGDNTTDGG